MGCCGGGRGSSPMGRPGLNRGVNRAVQAVPRPIPMPSRAVQRAVTAPNPGGESSLTILPSGDAKVCKACGSRAAIQYKYNPALRRYFSVPWCSACNREAK